MKVVDGKLNNEEILEFFKVLNIEIAQNIMPKFEKLIKKIGSTFK